MTKADFHYDASYTQDRELSWLKFNQRVLEEAKESSVPLYERLKFVSIFTSNLDEFFMVRVGSIYDLSLLKKTHIDNKSGMTPNEQLSAIFKAVTPLYKQRDKIFAEIEEQLRQYDICNLGIKELAGKEKKFIDDYFHSYVLPVLSPQVVDAHHPFPHLVNKSINIVVMLRDEDKKTLYGILPMPHLLPYLVFLPGSSVRYVQLERILLEYADEVFQMYEITDKAIVSVTRNADINPDDESFDVEDDYRLHMKKLLKKRARLAPVRLEVLGDICPDLLKFLCEKLKLKPEQVFHSKCPLKMSYVFSLLEKFSLPNQRQLTYPPFQPQYPASVVKSEPMIRQILRQDILLFYPYEQMDPFLRLLREASTDPNVISIKITIYRLANQSKLIEYLTTAVENNKDVTVLMELRARFDEQSNIDWSDVLEQAGCKVIYGFENFKVHSKICLITRREKAKIQHITQVGTGNYNEKTAKLYTDFCLMTANSQVGRDAAAFFQNMAISNLDGQYSIMLVAPTGLKTGIMKLIEGEISKARSGAQGKIFMKMNSLTDREIIDKLAEASQAGVKIDLNIRGICCLIPQVEGKTDNIRVFSIVGRFLEHPRIYRFGDGADARMYIGSADMMTRNTERRVEILCPVLDRQVEARINRVIEVLLRDNVKARVLQSNALYAKIPRLDAPPLDSQEYFMNQAVLGTSKRAELDAKRESNNIFKKLFAKFKK